MVVSWMVGNGGAGASFGDSFLPDFPDSPWLDFLDGFLLIPSIVRYRRSLESSTMEYGRNRTGFELAKFSEKEKVCDLAAPGNMHVPSWRQRAKGLGRARNLIM